jgi:hypothetical protein
MWRPDQGLSNMKRATFTLAAGLILAGTAVPQDLLPPGVLLLSRVKRHIKEELERLQNVSCLETVQREFKPARGKMRPQDTVRLEVLTNGYKELYASPGDRKFSEGHPIAYAGIGALGNGYFALYLSSILVSGNVTYRYKGEQEIGGRGLARYEYQLPVMWSGQIIETPEGSGTVGFHGSFWADPETYDVVRLELIADDFPPTLPVTELVTTINYARTSLGEAVLLLPESAEFRMAKFSGEVNHSQIGFTHCRAFGAETTIHFGDDSDDTPRFGVASVDDTLRPLPAGLRIAVKLRTRLSADMSVGTLIDGVVAGNVRGKGVRIAVDSPMRGRIRRLERYTDPFPYFVVALEFTEVESQGIRRRFYADLVAIESAPGVEQTLSNAGKATASQGFNGGWDFKRTIETLELHSLPGVATFFLKGGKLDLPVGFRTVWKTRTWAP